MIRINLLPASERQSNTNWGRIFALAGVFVLLFCGAMYGYGLYTEQTLEEELQQARNRYELLRQTREQMTIAGEKQQLINNKNAVLMTLTNERKSWNAALARLGVITPPPVWLTEMNTNGKDVTLRGMAVNYPDLAGFIEKIGQDTFFTEPVLIKAEQDTILSVTRFELSIKIKGM